MRIEPKKFKDEKEVTLFYTKRVAIIIAFISTYFFFIKILFL